jgi:gas vesicle protein
MKVRRKETGDASFLLGTVLGLTIGAAVTIILSPRTREDNRERLSEEARRSQQALLEKRQDIQDTLASLRQETKPKEKGEVAKAQEKVADARSDVAKADEAAAKASERAEKAQEKLAETKEELASKTEKAEETGQGE